MRILVFLVALTLCSAQLGSHIYRNPRVLLQGAKPITGLLNSPISSPHHLTHSHHRFGHLGTPNTNLHSYGHQLYNPYLRGVNAYPQRHQISYHRPSQYGLLQRYRRGRRDASVGLPYAGLSPASLHYSTVGRHGVVPSLPYGYYGSALPHSLHYQRFPYHLGAVNGYHYRPAVAPVPLIKF
ncbi:uncharacterized protein [Macrobrachium rosenbergii]|uniref:uncharacterized protein n=1 Tax=Macrobrachium rosenbergii TaxID=79674 RepID=UPI0034D6C809